MPDFTAFERSRRVFKEPVVFEGTVSFSPAPGRALYVDPAGSNSNDGLSWETAKQTVTAALAAASAGDWIYLAPGSYDEAVTITKDNIVLIGAGSRGQCAIAPSAGNAVAITIDGTTGTGRVEGVSLFNVGGEGNGTGGGLHVKGDIRRFRAYASKFEGGAFATKLESTAEGSVGDTVFYDCEFAWSTHGVHFVVSGGGSPVTQTRFQECWFHNQVTSCINVDTVHTADLWVKDSDFNAQEDGTEPTDYVLASVAGTTGQFSGNRFATPTNAAATLNIAAGVFWAANATEAGWSTGRPA